MNEQFIEFFDTDLVRIPIEHPRWLCGCRHLGNCHEGCHQKRLALEQQPGVLHQTSYMG